MLIVLILVACGGRTDIGGPTTSGDSPGTTSDDSTGSSSSSSTVDSATSTTGPSPVDGWLLTPTLDEMPDTWARAFVIGYGEQSELLGVAPGGENLMLGPDYGAQAPDGTWWFLDGAKRRFAHFDADGAYLGEVLLPDQYLANGQYFQFQLPRILADGTLLATRFGPESTQFLRLDSGEVGVDSVEGTFLSKADDGEVLYGFDVDGALKKYTPGGTVEPTEWYVAQAGYRYSLGFSDGGVVVELPDLDLVLTMPLAGSNGPGTIHASVELATGADGSLHLFLLGISESDETQQLGGYALISPLGIPGQMESILDPFTPSDPGSPAHFGIAYGSSQPWFMVVGEQGVEVYVRK